MAKALFIPGVERLALVRVPLKDTRVIAESFPAIFLGATVICAVSFSIAKRLSKKIRDEEITMPAIYACMMFADYKVQRLPAWHGDRFVFDLVDYGIKQTSHALEFSQVNCEYLYTSLRGLSLGGSETFYPQGYRRVLLASHGLHRFSSKSSGQSSEYLLSETGVSESRSGFPLPAAAGPG
jgi:hypothetical protein